MSPSLFRYTIIAYIVLAIFGGVFDLIFPSAIPETLSLAKEVNETNLSSIALTSVAIVGLVTLLGGIVATIGLFLFLPWAPHFAVVITILTFFASLFLGADVASGWSMALTSLSDTLWGAILALAYFPPLKERFLVTL